jgi:hypothetical protein
MRRLFYATPRPLEDFVQAVGASVVEETPRVSVALLSKRWVGGSCLGREGAHVALAT